MNADDRPAMPASAVVRSVPLGPEAVLALQSLAESLGFDVSRIDLAGCIDKACLLECIAGTLDFPDWFGQNWDGLYDCLADLGWRPARGYLLVLEHAEALQRYAPEALDTALAIFEDAAAAWAERGLQFRVFIDTPASPTREPQPGVPSRPG